MEDELVGNAIVIDDDTATVNLLAEFLEIKGMRVVGKGYSGQDAVELFSKLRPDVIFLDIMMPRADGFYALERIRQVDRKAHVIVVTADLSARTADRIEELQVPYIYKPYAFEEVVKMIKKLLILDEKS